MDQPSSDVANSERVRLGSLNEEQLWIGAYMAAMQTHVPGVPEWVTSRCEAMADDAIRAFRARYQSR